MDGDISRGRVEFAAIIVLGTVVFLGIGAVAWLRSGEINGMGTVGRPIVLLALGLLAAGGRSWARTAAAMWMGVIALVFSPSAVPVIADNLGAGIFIIVVGLLFGGAAFRLYTSPSIDAFVTSRSRTAVPPAS